MTISQAWLWWLFRRFKQFNGSDPFSFYPLLRTQVWSPGRHVTVYHMIWATEQTHCVTWYGFSKCIEPVNNIGYTMVPVIICPSLPVIIGPLLPMIIGQLVPMIIQPLLQIIWLNIPVKTRPKTCFLDRKWVRYRCFMICKICQWLFANDYWSIGADDYSAIAANDSAEHSGQHKAKNIFFR